MSGITPEHGRVKLDPITAQAYAKHIRENR